MNEHTLARYGDNVRKAVELRDEAIRQASDEGWSLRQIAAAVGVSHMTVSKIIRRS